MPLDKQKIRLWRIKEMIQELSVAHMAVIFIKLKRSYPIWDKGQKFERETDAILFNPDAFFNAFKEWKPNSLKNLNNLIKNLESDSNAFIEYHHSLAKKINEKSHNYDKFDLSFDDVLFNPKGFADPRVKKIIN